MLVDVTLPRLGSTTMEAGVIIQWLCAVGDRVEEGQALAELDTDKVQVDLPSPVTGVVTELVAVEGDERPVGAVIARIETGAV